MSIRNFVVPLAFLVLPNGRSVPPSAGYLKTGMPDHPQVTKGLNSRLGPPASGSFTPATFRGPALNGHPCPGGALAASMPLGPLHATCVQPAPKSRFVVSGLSRTRATRAGANAPRFFDACIIRPLSTLICAALLTVGARLLWAALGRSAGNRQQIRCMRCIRPHRVA